MTEVMKLGPGEPDPALVGKVASVLRGAGVAAFPTDTVYGLGCSGRSARGLERLREIKGDRSSPFILLIASVSWLDGLVKSVTPLAQDLIDRYWPGPLTIVLDAAPGVKAGVSSGTGSVAVRLPLSKWCISLCEELDAPVASTSANIKGRPTACCATEILSYFGQGLDIIIDGGASSTTEPSTLVDARGPEPIVLRQGAVRLN